ncbi:MAG: hypothetical protein FWD58_10575 [Firmicutes bacterium]|nr:hypothetical protein [Bacillota bacterium]
MSYKKIVCLITTLAVAFVFAACVLPQSGDGVHGEGCTCEVCNPGENVHAEGCECTECVETQEEEMIDIDFAVGFQTGIDSIFGRRYQEIGRIINSPEEWVTTHNPNPDRTTLAEIYVPTNTPPRLDERAPTLEEFAALGERYDAMFFETRSLILCVFSYRTLDGNDRAVVNKVTRIGKELTVDGGIIATNTNYISYDIFILEVNKSDITNIDALYVVDANIENWLETMACFSISYGFVLGLLTLDDMETVAYFNDSGFLSLDDYNRYGRISNRGEDFDYLSNPKATSALDKETAERIKQERWTMYNAQTGNPPPYPGFGDVIFYYGTFEDSVVVALNEGIITSDGFPGWQVPPIQGLSTPWSVSVWVKTKLK